MPPLLEPPTLTGERVRLEPLSVDHIDDLIAAAGADRSTFDFTLVPDGPDSVRGYVRYLTTIAVPAGESIPFAQIRVADGRAVGVTTYLTLRWQANAALPYAIEVGGTWLAQEAQRSGLNVEAKLLLFTHAFEVWDVGRLDLKTHARNARSRAAIEAVGAQFEGVLRAWSPSHARGEAGLLRDTAMYSILAAEWPDVRDLLCSRLSRADAS